MNRAHRQYREEIARANHRDRMDGIYTHGMRDRRARERGVPLSTHVDEHSVCTAHVHNPLLFYGVDVHDLMKGSERWLRLRLSYRWLHLALVPGTEVDFQGHFDHERQHQASRVTFDREGASFALNITIGADRIEDGERETLIIDAIYNAVCDAGDDVRDHWFKPTVG